MHGDSDSSRPLSDLALRERAPTIGARVPRLSPPRTSTARIAAFFDGFAATTRLAPAEPDLLRPARVAHRFLIPEDARCSRSARERRSARGAAALARRRRRREPGDGRAGAARHPELEFVSRRRALRARRAVRLRRPLRPRSVRLRPPGALRNVRAMTHDRSRVVIHSYSQLWRPVIRLAELLRLKPRKPIRNWVTPDDVATCSTLAGFEVVSTRARILFPKHVPLLSTFLNGFVANIWPLSYLCADWWVVARPRPSRRGELSVSVVVPCRNEAGNDRGDHRAHCRSSAPRPRSSSSRAARRTARARRSSGRSRATRSARSRFTSRPARARATRCGSASRARRTSS